MNIRTIYIHDNQSLQEVSAYWKTCDWIGMDTEFIRRGTFHPQPALIQVYDGEKAALIDPLVITEWKPFAELLLNSEVLKIMHAPLEDIEVFHRLLNCVPVSLVDTQLAAAFCNMHYPVSYQALTRELLGVSIDKREVCSDWTVRPLTDTQTSYAAVDVYYLHSLYKALKNRMSSRKHCWFVQECNSQFGTPKTPEDAWQESALASMLMHPGQRAVLKALYLWREKYIRQYDIPRRHMLTSPQLISLSRKQPASLRALRAVEGMTPKHIRKYGKDVVAVIGEVKRMIAGTNTPDISISWKITKDDVKAISSSVHKVCQNLCRDHEMNPAGLLPGKRYAAYLIQSFLASGVFRLPEGTAPWKQTLFQPEIEHLQSTYRDLAARDE